MSRSIRSPNFFIAGAAKCGTSSLASYIAQHPDVFICPVKEPFFFVKGVGLNDYDEYLSLFSKANQECAIGEASTGYLYDLHASCRIYAKFPQAKIIVVLRNPVDMAFSLWRYITVTGGETKTFEEATRDEEREYRRSEKFQKSCAGWWANYLYIERACYFEQVRKYLGIFGQNHVRVYIFERFVKEPEKICQNIFDFLEVNSSFIPDCQKVVNPGGVVRFQLLRRARNRRYPLLRLILPERHRVRIRNLSREINIKKGEKPVMSSSTRNFLQELFREDIARLESLLGEEITEWRKILTK